MAWLGAISICLILISIGITTMPILSHLEVWWLSFTFLGLAIAWVIGCIILSKRNNRIELRKKELDFSLRSLLRHKVNPMELNPHLELELTFYRPNPFPFGVEEQYIKDIKLSWLNVDEAKKLDCYFANIHKERTFHCQVQDMETRRGIPLFVGETSLSLISELGAGELQGKLIKGLDGGEKEAMDKYYEIEAIGEKLSYNFSISFAYPNGKRKKFEVRLRE